MKSRTESSARRTGRLRIFVHNRTDDWNVSRRLGR